MATGPKDDRGFSKTASKALNESAIVEGCRASGRSRLPGVEDKIGGRGRTVEDSKVCCNLRAMVLSMDNNVGDDLMQRCLKRVSFRVLVRDDGLEPSRMGVQSTPLYLVRV